MVACENKFKFPKESGFIMPNKVCAKVYVLSL